MLFNSYVFVLIFLPAALLLYHLFYRIGSAWAAAALTLASFVFYAWWDISFLPLLIASIVFNYFVGLSITRWRNVGSFGLAKLVMATGIAIDLSVLMHFKYSYFFSRELSQLSGIELGMASVVLPLGISFYTFTQVAYLADCLQGKASERNLIYYALFVSYFPHQIAGPILHHSEMIWQFRSRNAFEATKTLFPVGLGMFAIGLFKKVVIADNFAPQVNPVFELAEAGHAIGLFEAWGGALGYYFQLYFDFSAYSDMAIGLSLLFGVKLPLNFDSPYKSTSIIEFWRRWHITLSRFLRNYLYFALGGNRKGKVRRYVNLMVTMALGGLWHGAGYTFLVWGAIHGALLAINHGWRAIVTRSRLLTAANRFATTKVAAWAITTLCVVLAWVFFRAHSVSGAWHLASAMFSLDNLVAPPFLQPFLSGISGIRFDNNIWLTKTGGGSNVYFLMLGLGFVIVLTFPNAAMLFSQHAPTIGMQPSEENFGWSLRWKPTILWAVFLSAILAFAFTRIGANSTFLYFNF